jgi:hypothetical protein
VLRLARPALGHRLERDRHGSGDRPLHGGDVGVATWTNARHSANSRSRPERHVSVLHGTVPELARNGEVGRSFALFYTGVLGAGGLAPIAYGTIADHSNKTVAILAAALTAAAIIPMVLALRPFLSQVHNGAAGHSDP